MYFGVAISHFVPADTVTGSCFLDTEKTRSLAVGSYKIIANGVSH